MRYMQANRTRFIAQAAVIAAIYTGLTLLFAPFSYKEIQLRVSEILTVLPFFTPSAIPGLFIGCLIANFYSPNGIADIVVGSLATLIAAVLSYLVPRKWMAPMPPVLVNAVMVGAMLAVMYNLPLLTTIIYVAVGQAIVCYGMGYPLLLILEKYKGKILELNLWNKNEKNR